MVDSVQGDFTLGFCFQLNLKVKKQIGRYIGIDIATTRFKEINIFVLVLTNLSCRFVLL